MKMKTLVLGGLVIAAAFAGGWALALAQSRPHGPGGFGPPFMRGMGPGGMGPGMMRHMGSEFDPSTSPGVRGMGPGMMGRGMMGGAHDSATMAQMRDIHALLGNHDRIRRSVTNLPDGIRTITESDDPEVAALIKTHVAQMGERVEAGDDPGLPIESPALRAIFKGKDTIKSAYETTDKGVIVTQTSTDPKTVAVLQEHAAEVTDLVNGGMAALHTAMMRNHGGIVGGGMTHGPVMQRDPAVNHAPTSR
jgi:hypothetical protein